MMKTVAYMRVSTEAQTEKNGLEQQRAEISAWGALKKVFVDEWHTEAETGMREDRPVIQSLLKRAQSGEVFTLVLDRVDRLGRLAHIVLKLEADFKVAGCEVVFVNQVFDDTPMGEFMLGQMALMAQYNRKEWLKRMKACKSAARRTKGKWSGGQLPFGYRVVGNGQLAIDDDSAALVRLCFSLRDAGATLVKIADELTRAGYRSKHGGPANVSLVHGILKRRAVYEARAAFGEEQPEAGVRVAHPPILQGSNALHVSVPLT